MTFLKSNDSKSWRRNNNNDNNAAKGDASCPTIDAATSKFHDCANGGDDDAGNKAQVGNPFVVNLNPRYAYKSFQGFGAKSRTDILASYIQCCCFIQFLTASKTRSVKSVKIIVLLFVLLLVILLGFRFCPIDGAWIITLAHIFLWVMYTYWSILVNLRYFVNFRSLENSIVSGLAVTFCDHALKNMFKSCSYLYLSNLDIIK